MTQTQCTDFHWIGETLMAKEFGEVFELCQVDWSGLDEYEAEHKRLIAAAPDMCADHKENARFLGYLVNELQGLIPEGKLEALELCRVRAERSAAKSTGEAQ